MQNTLQCDRSLRWRWERLSVRAEKWNDALFVRLNLESEEIVEHAIWSGQVDIVKQFYDANNVNIPNAGGIRPLQIACLQAFPNEMVVAYLLVAGASVDFEVAPGVTLIQAVEAGVAKNPHRMDILNWLKKAVLNAKLNDMPRNPTVAKPRQEMAGDVLISRTASGKTKM